MSSGSSPSFRPYSPRYESLMRRPTGAELSADIFYPISVGNDSRRVHFSSSLEFFTSRNSNNQDGSFLKSEITTIVEMPTGGFVTE